MKLKTLITTFCMALLTNLAANAGEPQPSKPPTLKLYAGIVEHLLQANPEIRAQQAAVDAARARLKGAALPLNNPELEGDAENTDINTITLGLSQTVDWHDKRSALESVAQAELTAAQAELALMKLEKSTELLQVMGEIATQNALNDIAERRTDILRRFARLAGKRHQAGVIPQAELDLARLSLSEAIIGQAGQQADLIEANHAFYALSGKRLDNRIPLPDELPKVEHTGHKAEDIARQHPAVQSAWQRAQAARLEIEAADRQRKADPTFGLTAGAEDSEALIGLSFSVPLQIRNDFSSEVDSARALANSAEQQARQAFWQQRARLQAARSSYQAMHKAWTHWTTQGQASLKNRFDTLEKLWRSGEMSTTDYLVQVQQTLDTQAAGIELKGRLWAAWIEWLSASNLIETYFQ